jgi:hypothetical protein
VSDAQRCRITDIAHTHLIDPDTVDPDIVDPSIINLFPVAIARAGFAWA